MFNDDFFGDDDFRDIEDLLIEFFKIKRGEPHGIVSEEDFEYLIDYFETNSDRENAGLACDIASTLYPFSLAYFTALSAISTGLLFPNSEYTSTPIWSPTTCN
mgnify:CR=1 FL=1